MSECDQEINHIKKLHMDMEDKFKKILLNKENIVIDNNEKMTIYGKISNTAQKSRQESLWISVNETLYKYYQERITAMLNIKLKQISKMSGYYFLIGVKETWNLMKIFIRWNITLFQPIEKYIKAYYNSKTLCQTAVEILKEKLVLHHKDTIIKELFKEFEKERKHDNFDSSLNQETFHYFLICDYECFSNIMLVDSKFEYVYTGKPDKQKIDTFSELILEQLKRDTKDFYSRFVHEHMSQAVNDFLDLANKYIDEEKERMLKYYNIKDFKDEVWNTLTKELIENPANTLITNKDGGLYSMLKNENFTYARKLYNFVAEIKHDMSTFIAHLVDYIKHKITEIKEKEPTDAGEQSQSLVGDIISFRTQLLTICKDCFNDNSEIKSSVNLHLQKLLSQVANFPKFLADYIDHFMVKYGKENDNNTSTDEIEEIFNIINLTAERDAFLHYYEIALKNRLLSQSTIMEDIEKNFLSRLSQLFGENQIMKVKGMINDIVGSRDTLQKFKEYLQARKERQKIIEGKEFEICMLTKANWPTEVMEDNHCIMPSSQAGIANEYNNHYTSSMQGRRVEWLLNEGSVMITSPKFNKRFTINVPQQAIIEVIDSSIAKALTLEQILEKTGLDEKSFKNNVFPFMRIKLISRSSKDQKAAQSKTEKWYIGDKCEHKQKVVNLVPRRNLRGRDTAKDQSNINDMRKHVIEAAIVRIMKSNKQLEFKDLSVEVRKVVEHFPPADRQLRQMLEDLIKREYLERDDKNMNSYIYKA